MADTKISAMSAASALGGTEALPGVQAAANVKITATQIATFILTTPVFIGTGTTITPAVRTSGVAPYLTVNAPADTTLTASAEAPGVHFVGAIRQHATGALALQREFIFAAPTYSFVAASTITEAATVDFTEPTTGANATITRKYVGIFKGMLAVRQPAGTAGTDELQISHDGSTALIQNMDAAITLRAQDVIASVNANRYFYGIEAGSAAAYFFIHPTAIAILSGAQLYWSAAATNVFNGPDVGLKRAAAGVLGVTDGGSGTMWLQDAGRTRVTADVTNATITMANITGLSATLIAGRKYIGELTVYGSDSVAADGIMFDFDGGTATATSFVAGLDGTPTGTTVGVIYSTALATDLTITTATTADTVYRIPFEIVVNAGGTFIPRFAKSSHTTGTATARRGSHIKILDCTN